MNGVFHAAEQTRSRLEPAKLRLVLATIVTCFALLSLGLGAFAYGLVNASDSVTGTLLTVSQGLFSAVAIAGAAALGLLRVEYLSYRHHLDGARYAHHDATHDALTGLLNRDGFEIIVGRALRVCRPATLFLIDLDPANRGSGSFGEVVIKELALRLKETACAEIGQASRVSQNRFGLFLPVEDADEIDRICEALVSVCRRPVQLGARAAEPVVQIGVVSLGTFGHSDPPSFETLLRCAGYALMAARTDGHACAHYDKALDSRFIHYLNLADDLPRAIHDGWLEVYLQPRVMIDGAKVFGFESLVRWRRGEFDVPASEIIRAAEDAGLIVDLDRYMLDEAVRVMADWNRRRKTAFSLSVNLSTEHFRKPQGLDFVHETLAKHGFPPELLTLEVSQTAVLERRAALSPILARLRAAGCRLAIDDFGAAATALASLRTLDADEIKIDPSLVCELEGSDEARFILDAVLQMARNLHIDIVIEGVERDAQAQVLMKLGCKTAQGFLFGRPRPANDWLADATYGAAAARA